MTAVRSGVTTSQCPACGGHDVRRNSPSRATGLATVRCPACGLVALADPDFGDPSEIVVADWDAEAYAAYVDLKREGAGDTAWNATLNRLDGLVGAVEDRSLFDVGAGDGGFLDLARRKGFRPAGNEIMSGAVALAKSKYDIDLSLGDLSVLDLPEKQFDALTLWCVLAHVPDPDQLLRAAYRLLKPGGVLFLQTPRWTSMDGAALAALRASHGRVSRVLDRRVASHHWQLHTERSMTAALRRSGYEPVSIKAEARYSLKSWSYVESLGVPHRASLRIGTGLDRLLDRGMFFRIVMDVYARRPLT